MQFYVGTSGYSYKEWKGIFYPEKLSQKKMLSCYAERFSTVEANNAFRFLPSESAVAAWAPQTPESFRFAIKAPQAITHFKRLSNVEAEVEQFLRVAAVLKERQGPLLFQLPPNFKKDLPRLKAFLDLIPKHTASTFEFRHDSWFDDEVYACLRAKSCALCAGDTDEEPIADLVSTAGWGYLRLRREKYTDKQLRDWIAKIKAQNWSEAYVYFKHEDSATGPKFAKRFLELTDENETVADLKARITRTRDRMRRIPKSIEVVSEPVATILRKKTPAERAKIASDLHKSARTMIDSFLRHEHPDWTNEQIRVEMIRRLIGGTG